MLCLGAICADAGISISMSEEALKNYFNDLPKLLKSGNNHSLSIRFSSVHHFLFVFQI